MIDRFNFFPPSITDVYIRTMDGDIIKIKNPITVNSSLEAFTGDTVRGRLEIEYDSRNVGKIGLVDPIVSIEEFEKLLLE